MYHTERTRGTWTTSRHVLCSQVWHIWTGQTLPCSHKYVIFAPETSGPTLQTENWAQKKQTAFQSNNYEWLCCHATLRGVSNRCWGTTVMQIFIIDTFLIFWRSEVIKLSCECRMTRMCPVSVTALTEHTLTHSIYVLTTFISDSLTPAPNTPYTRALHLRS